MGRNLGNPFIKLHEHSYVALKVVCIVLDSAEEAIELGAAEDRHSLGKIISARLKCFMESEILSLNGTPIPFEQMAKNRQKAIQAPKKCTLACTRV
jgi:hypothetical protein